MTRIESNAISIQTTITPPQSRQAAPQPALGNLSGDATNLSNIGTKTAPFSASPLRFGNKIDLLVDGKRAFERIDALIDGAQKRLDVQFFLFNNDPTGARIAQKLSNKAKSGVQVNLLLDNMFNWQSSKLIQQMRDAGVRIHDFKNTLTNYVDHRKILIADEKVAMTGGMNIGAEYEHYWHDFMDEMKGPGISSLIDYFGRSWYKAGGDPLRYTKPNLSVQGNVPLQVAVTSPTEKEIEASLIAGINAAKKKILVLTPFLTDNKLCDALAKAADRGVKVIVILPSKSDVPPSDMLHQKRIRELFYSGAKVFEYQTSNPHVPKPGPATDFINHGKVYSIDGEWTSIGSANGDSLSMRVNNELNLHVDSAEFAKRVEKEIFEHDIKSGKALPAGLRDLTVGSYVVEELLDSMDALF